ncbi:Protein mak11 [Malassezia sp. CBS 17886]|nr:Protein mak11 [Malassezia sp. CBS 17886]
MSEDRDADMGAPVRKRKARIQAQEEGVQAAAPQPRTKHRAVPKHAEATGLRIVAGSYERFLYGIATFVHEADDGSMAAEVKPQFVFPAHVSSIRSVACAGEGSKWLVTGGTDETIKVWDLRRRREVGALQGHEGTITSLSFPSRTFMLSTSEDGTINLYRTRDWSLLRTLRGHTGRVNWACAHPSGRVALSVGADRTIRMWDLMRGVGSGSVKIGIEAERIDWNTTGHRFGVLAGRQVMVFATDMTKLAEVESPKRVHDLCFVRMALAGGAEHELLLVASDAGVVHVFDLDDLIGKAADEDDDGDASVPQPREIARLVGHGNRIGAASVRCGATMSMLAATISSDGFIRTFDLTAAVDGGGAVRCVDAIASYDTGGSRLTSMSVVGYNAGAGVGLEDENEDEDEEDNNEDPVDADAFSDDDVDAAEDSEEELARLEEQVREARAAGLVFEGDEEVDEGSGGGDSDDGDEMEEEVEGEMEE